MSPKTDAETRSPWYETFAPGMWVVAAVAAVQTEEEPEADPTDDEWATEAIFEYYND